MHDWDEDSPQLRRNFQRVLEEIIVRAEDQAEQRETPTVGMARHWQRLFIQGLKVEPRYVGAFRGEPGLERTGLKIGRYRGPPAARVSQELKEFEEKLQTAIAGLDHDIPIGAKLNRDQRDAVIWAHAEWVRIHPFANGNGRTARLWANFLAVRYGLPPFVRLRPRPNDGYEEAGAKAMQGDWLPTATVFRRLLARFLEEFRE